MANEHTPSAVSDLTPELWDDQIRFAVYEDDPISQTFEDLGKSGERIHVRKYGALSRTTPIGTDPLTLNDLTRSIGTDSEVTATPTTSYVALVLNFNTVARMIQDPTNGLRRACEMSVAEGIGVSCCTLFDDLTAVVGGIGQDVTEATFLQAIENTRGAAKAAGGPGKRIFVHHYKQSKAIVVSTQNWAQWQIRGQSDLPVNIGLLKDAYGTRFIETGNVQNIGGLFHNGLYIPTDKAKMADGGATFGIGYNRVPFVRTEESGLATALMCATDFFVVTIWGDRGCDYQTQTV